jgi:hypothetical protein
MIGRAVDRQNGVREDLFGEPNMNRIGADDSVQGSTLRITGNAWSRLLWLMFDGRGQRVDFLHNNG